MPAQDITALVVVFLVLATGIAIPVMIVSILAAMFFAASVAAQLVGACYAPDR